jgi:hypothetical protein
MLMLPELGHDDDRHADCNDSYNQWLVAEFGPDVNIANASFDTVLDLEATRNGSGVAGPFSSQQLLDWAK